MEEEGRLIERKEGIVAKPMPSKPMTVTTHLNRSRRCMPDCPHPIDAAHAITSLVKTSAKNQLE